MSLPPPPPWPPPPPSPWQPPAATPTRARSPRLADLALLLGALSILLGPLTGLPAIAVGVAALGAREGRGRRSLLRAAAGLTTGAVMSAIFALAAVALLSNLLPVSEPTDEAVERSLLATEVQREVLHDQATRPTATSCSSAGTRTPGSSTVCRVRGHAYEVRFGPGGSITATAR